MSAKQKIHYTKKTTTKTYYRKKNDKSKNSKSKPRTVYPSKIAKGNNKKPKKRCPSCGKFM